MRDPATGTLLFNVLVGGYFSIKRNIMSVPLGVALTEDQLIPFTVAALRVFRWGWFGGWLVGAQASNSRHDMMQQCGRHGKDAVCSFSYSVTWCIFERGESVEA